MDFVKFFRKSFLPGPYKPRGVGGAAPPQIFAKADLLPIDNDSEKKKVAKKYIPYQIPRKLLITLLLSTSHNA